MSKHTTAAVSGEQILIGVISPRLSKSLEKLLFLEALVFRKACRASSPRLRQSVTTNSER